MVTYVALAGILIIALIALVIYLVEDYKEKHNPKHSGHR